MRAAAGTVALSAARLARSARIILSVRTAEDIVVAREWDDVGGTAHDDTDDETERLCLVVATDDILDACEAGDPDDGGGGGEGLLAWLWFISEADNTEVCGCSTRPCGDSCARRCSSGGWKACKVASRAPPELPVAASAPPPVWYEAAEAAPRSAIPAIPVTGRATFVVDGISPDA